VNHTTYSAHEKCAAITWKFISTVPTQLLSMRIGKIKKMTTAATMMTRNTMKMIHHHRHHHHHHLETIIHTIQNEEPGDSDLHTYSDKDNISNDWRNKNKLL
jgi:hypothetical protein